MHLGKGGRIEMRFEDIKKYYSGKKVFVTGHTGFKGTWLCKILKMAGAEVVGYALEQPRNVNIYDLLNIDKEIESIIGDVRDFSKLKRCIETVKPEYVFHLAAQPIVRESYKIPRETFEINVMGTVNVLECIRTIPGIKSFVNITTDKVYENDGMFNHPFKEDEKLDGFDPYSNSKSCSELVTHSYKNSFFAQKNSTIISTVRAGNVIGGGDFSVDRIIPDCVRAAINEENICIRNPYSVRPYQHVLEALNIYLTLAIMQEQKHEIAGCYNVGPNDEDCISTGKLADMFVKYWGNGIKWEDTPEICSPHEASFLKLDCTKIKRTLNWTPKWNVEDAVRETVEWYRAWANDEAMDMVTEKQIYSFFD